ncbi:hypothetical protein IQ241_07890 [Romeria aff. gracilis LEGE 07310]|uniref:Uncharacterized protein n=1 Tax=Vasconcelosia minhoensis LEGE 07310 TaxID=915328 RepID=A0A8J7A6Z3_9CYAN|nr:hypothetical protein [Romeria gracilis]MBE9077215.1 hypothetical protein [Romeria aff. gracilis LEGE 07310]
MPTPKQLAHSLAALASMGDEAKLAQLLEQLNQLPVETQQAIRRVAMTTVERASTGKEVMQRQFQQHPLAARQKPEPGAGSES